MKETIIYPQNIDMEKFDNDQGYRKDVLVLTHLRQWEDDGAVNVEWANLYDFLVDRAAKLG
jgi:hypothetical protein